MPETEWTETQKIAALLLSLDEAAAGAVLSHLDADTITEIGGALDQIDPRDLTEEELEELHQEFALAVQSTVKRPDLSTKGLTNLLERTLGEDRARELTENIEARAHEQQPFRPLLDLDPVVLQTILQDEHPQVLAVVCSYLPPELVAVIVEVLAGRHTRRSGAASGQPGYRPTRSVQAARGRIAQESR